MGHQFQNSGNLNDSLCFFSVNVIQRLSRAETATVSVFSQLCSISINEMTGFVKEKVCSPESQVYRK